MLQVEKLFNLGPKIIMTRKLCKNGYTRTHIDQSYAEIKKNLLSNHFLLLQGVRYTAS